MLTLTRRVGEAVMVGSDVTIPILGAKGNQARVGVLERTWRAKKDEVELEIRKLIVVLGLDRV